MKSMNFLFCFMIAIYAQATFAETFEVPSDQIGLYRQKIIDAAIQSSIICIKQGGILRPNYVIPTEELFHISSVQQMTLENSEPARNRASVSMRYQSEQQNKDYLYTLEMSSDLNLVYQLQIVSRKRTWINLGSLLEPNLIQGPIQDHKINCHSLK